MIRKLIGWWGRVIKKILLFLYDVMGLPYMIVKKAIQIIIEILKKTYSAVKSFMKYVVNTLSFIYKLAVRFVKYLPVLLKKLGKWFIAAVKESIAQIFTLLGFFIAWLTLTGGAKDIVGIAILASTALWLVTINLRND
tara:strand:- start:395 stop:808 length:414 start_codon:yes stop_codon:yes gene_type:complete